MLRAPAAAMGDPLQQEQQQQHHRRQQQLLVLFNASSRSFASMWPLSNASAAASGGPAHLAPGSVVEESVGGSGGGASGSGHGGDTGVGSGAGVVVVGGVGGGVGGGEGGQAVAPGAATAGASPVNPWDVALCATGTAVACENALVLAALFYTPSLRAPMFLLIGSLALADLLAGLGLVVNFGLQYLLQPPSEAASLGAAGLLLAAFSASVCSSLAITLDRYLSLHHALTYHSERARGATAALLLLMWLLCGAAALLPLLLGWNCLREPRRRCSILRPVTKDHASVLAVALLLLFALMAQLYLQICKVAVRHAQQIAVQRQFAASAQAASSSSSSSSSSSTRKGLSTLSLILGTFALCWVPIAVYALVADASYPPVYAYSLALPAACNSLVNPVIYAFRNPDIQKSLWLACCSCLPAGLFSRPRTSSDV